MAKQSLKIMKVKTIFFSIFFFSFVFATAQQIAFQTNLEKISSGKLTQHFNQAYFLKTTIFQHSLNGNIVFSEKNIIQTDAAGNFVINIGSGKNINGNIDSVNWSDDSFFLILESDTSKKNQTYFKYSTDLRIPTELNQNNLEGMINDDESKGWGNISIPNNKGRRPKKITADLSTQYVNIAYPADTYPIYRHYEWFDLDGNGLGNSFMLTYSEKTRHEFFENTNKLGDVKLYAKAFQELQIKGLDHNIELFLTKPEKIANLSETYAIKGPWKLIYFIEW
jgi:hypothetical protein